MREKKMASSGIDRYSLLPAPFKHARNHDRVSARWSLAISVGIGLLVASIAAAYQRHQSSVRMHRHLANSALPAWMAKQTSHKKMIQADTLERQLSRFDRFRPTDELLQTMGAIGASIETVPAIGCTALSIDRQENKLRLELIGSPSGLPEVSQVLSDVDRIESVSLSDSRPSESANVAKPVPGVLMMLEGTLVRNEVSAP